MKFPHLNIQSFYHAHDVRNVIIKAGRPSACAVAAVWDYKAAGFTRVGDAIESFNADFKFLNDPSRQRSKKERREHPHWSAESDRILSLLIDKRAAEKADREWLGTFDFVESIGAVQAAITDSIKNNRQDAYGEWARSGTLLNDGTMLIATFSTDTEWTGKNDKWPHKTRSTKVEIFSAPRVLERTAYIPSRSGNWMQSAAIKLLKPRRGGVNNINLHEKVRAKPAGKRMGVIFYARTIAGEPLDYVAVIGKQTFHAATKRAALSGLANKINKKIRAGRGTTVLNYDFCRSLGFCKSGIASFCDVFGIDIHGTYSRKTIREITHDDARAEAFSWELKKAGVTE